MSGNPGKIKSNKKTRYPATDYEKIFHPVPSPLLVFPLKKAAQASAPAC